MTQCLTLHQAFDAYLRAIDQVSSDPARPNDLYRKQLVATLKCHTVNVSLSSLTFNECQSIFDHWRNRPLSRTGKPYARKSASNYISELVRFFKWLELTAETDWRLPRGFDRIDLSVKRLELDRRSHPFRQAVFTVPELSLLNQYANEAERLLLYLSLNCGFGAAGLLRLRIADFLFDHQHEDAERIGLNSDERHSLLRFVRPRTDQFFEWILWPETVAVVRWAVDRCRSLDIETLFVTKDGRPLTRDDHRDPGACLRSRFQRLVGRVQRDRPEFPSLPFGTLRSSMAELIRCTAMSSEVTGLYLGHGSTPDIHTRMGRPFGHLHKALMNVRRELEPVFSNGGSSNG